MQPISQIRKRLSARNPQAPLDRNYQLVQVLFHRGAKASRHDPAVVRRVLKELRRKERACIVEQDTPFAVEDEAVTEAFNIHHGGPDIVRSLVEAYALAGLNEFETAAKLGLSPDAVRIYRRLFFAIESIRNSEIRVLHQVIGVTHPLNCREGDVAAFLKHVAFKYGVAVLDQVLGLGLTAPRATGEATVDWVAAEVESAAQLQRLRAVLQMNLNDPKQVQSLLKSAPAARGPGRDEDNPELNERERWIKDLIDQIPWAVGDDAYTVLKGNALLEYDELPGVLSADEVMRVAAGEEIPGLKEELAKPLPPPRRAKPTLESFTAVAKSLSEKNASDANAHQRRPGTSP